MPLARIITDVSEASLELAMSLRSRGYEVETISTTDVPDHPADLEVRLEECDAQDLESRTATLGAGARSVFVAPGALDESGRGGSAFFNPGTRAGFPANPRTRYPLPKEFARPAVEMEETATEAPLLKPANGNGHGAGRIEALPVAEIEVVAETPALRREPEPVLVTVISRTDAAMENTGAPTVATPELRADPGRMRIAEVATVPLEAVTPPLAGERAHQTRQAIPAAARRSSRDTRFWRTAIVSAALAAGVVTIGNLWHARKPAPAALPLPSASQKLPFQDDKKASTLPEAIPAGPQENAPASAAFTGSDKQQASTVSPAPGAPMPAVAVAPNSSTPAATTVAAAKPPTNPTNASVVHRAAAKKPAKKASKHDRGIVANNTVTHYNQKPAAPPASSSNQPAIKHYSDLD
jgi:hypothetical protein